MPSRRGFLVGAALAATLPLAGCPDRRGPPDYARWLHASDAVFAPDDWGFASVDAAAVRDERDRLPGAWNDAIDRIDEVVDAVALDDVERLTGQGAAAGNRIAVSVVVAGSFDASDAAGALREEYDGLERTGTVAGRPLYAYAPSFLEDLDETSVVDADASVDGTAALAVGEGTLVVGAAVGPSDGGTGGTDAVRAAVRAREGESSRLAGTDADAALALSEFGGADALVGARLPYGGFATDRAPDDPVRRLLRGLRVAALGAGVGDDGARLLLAYRDDRLPGVEDVRAALRALEDDTGVEVTDVEVRQQGRAFVLSTDRPVAGLWRVYRDATESKR